MADDNFDDLLDFINSPSATPDAAEEKPAVHSFDDILDEVKAEVPIEPVAAPTPVAEPSDEVASMRAELAELKALLLAQAKGSVSVNNGVIENAPAPVDPDDVVFHVETDGFTAFGEVWTRGSEFTINRNSREYKDTCDINGNSWIDKIDDEEWQHQRFGRIVVAPGRFRARPGDLPVVDTAAIDYRRRGQYPFNFAK